MTGEKHSQIASDYMKEFYSKTENKNKIIQVVNAKRVKRGLMPMPYTNVAEKEVYDRDILPKIKHIKNINKRHKRWASKIYNRYKRKSITLTDI